VEERILALDVGSRTLGLAVSDPLGITAQGLPTIRRKNRRADFAQLDAKSSRSTTSKNSWSDIRCA
jgi:RNase H-fold protein (predicted Holliday junction resolvase)